MGRKPTTNLNLPRGMRSRKQRSGKIYYYLDTGATPRKEVPLGPDYPAAVKKWAEMTVSKPPGELITFRHVAECYVRDVLHTKGAETQKDNLRELKRLYTFFDESKVALDSIEPLHIRQYLVFRISAKVRANREKALFSHIWNFARETGLTSKSNPCAGVKGHKETGRNVYIDDAIYSVVWEVAEPHLRDAMDLAYLTGQRPADVRKMSQSDIKGGAVSVLQNKGGKLLRVSVEGELASVIDRINAKKVVGMPLAAKEDGQRLTKAMLRGAFDRARIAAILAHPELAAQIKAFQFRDLRAKAGTDTEEIRGMAAAKDQLGHSSEIMTAQYVRHRRGKLVKPTK